MTLKRIILWLLVTTVPAWAQSDVTRDDLFQIGDTGTYHGLNPGNIGPGSAGTGVTWDFSNMSRDILNDYAIRYDSPNVAPNAANFPDANLVVVQGADEFRAYTFFDVNDSRFLLLGLDIPDLGVVTYTDFNVWINFPLKYNQTQTDPFQGSYEFSRDGITATAQRDGTLTTTYDGFGTVILPDGRRVERVRRLKLDQVLEDVVSLAGFNVSTRLENTTYVWLEEGKRLPLFNYTISNTTVTPPGTPITSRSATYRIDGGTGNPTVATRRGTHLTTQGGAFDSQIIVHNPSDSAQTLTLQPVTASGNQLPKVEVNLNAGATSRVLAEDYFSAEAGSFLSEGCASCIFSVGYRANIANPSTAQVHQTQTYQREFTFYPGEWQYLFDGQAIINTSDKPTKVTASQYDYNGNMLATTTLETSLAAGGKHLSLLNDQFSNNSNSLIKLESDEPIGVMVLRISNDFRFLYQNNPLPAVVSNNSGRWLAHVTSNSGGFDTDVFIHNRGNQSNTLTFQPYDNNGARLNTVDVTVEAGATKRFTKAELLPASTSHLSVNGSSDCIASVGYRSQAPAASTAVVHEAAPVGTSFTVFPGEWDLLFDGVALVNTGNAPADITLNQVGDDGQIIRTVNLTTGLAPNAKFLGLLEGRVPDNPNTIIRVESNQPLALLSLRLSKDNLYLYNNEVLPR